MTVLGKNNVEGFTSIMTRRNGGVPDVYNFKAAPAKARGLENQFNHSNRFFSAIKARTIFGNLSAVYISMTVSIDQSEAWLFAPALY